MTSKFVSVRFQILGESFDLGKWASVSKPYQTMAEAVEALEFMNSHEYGTDGIVLDKEPDSKDPTLGIYEVTYESTYHDDILVNLTTTKRRLVL